jgi:hypothetical protein
LIESNVLRVARVGSAFCQHVLGLERTLYLIERLLRPTSGVSRTALTGELEGEAAPAAEVGAEPQRSAEKSRGRPE